MMGGDGGEGCRRVKGGGGIERIQQTRATTRWGERMCSTRVIIAFRPQTLPHTRDVARSVEKKRKKRRTTQEHHVLILLASRES